MSRPLANPRAEAEFMSAVARGRLPDTDVVRRAIAADAHYMMNHTGVRFSEAVSSACQAFPRLASPLALSILSESNDDLVIGDD